MRIFLLVIISLLSSCGLIQDRSSEYTLATPSTEIVIPEGLSDRNIQSQYPIPQVNNKRPLSSNYELPKPPNATAALDDAPYTIDQVNDQLWLRLYLAPGKVWPLVDAFWQEYQIDTIEENISKGFVVTDIINDVSKLKVALADKSAGKYNFDGVYFQASLAQGIRRNTSEIKVRVIDSAGEEPVKIWQKKSIDIERDRAILDLMGSFITSDALQNRYSMLANSIGGESRIQLLQNSEGQNYLLMSLSFQRAWNELEKAIVASKVVLADKDISSRTFYISYINESEISHWYASNEDISEKKIERNFALTFKESENSKFIVEIEQLNESLEPSLKNDLLDLIYEHIN